MIFILKCLHTFAKQDRIYYEILEEYEKEKKITRDIIDKVENILQDKD